MKPSTFTIDPGGSVLVYDLGGVSVKLSFELIHQLAVEVERWKRLQKESRKGSARELRSFDAYRAETSRVDVGNEVEFEMSSV